MHRSRSRCLLAAWLLISILPLNAEVRPVPPLRFPVDLRQLTQRAGMIFSGKVMSVKPERSAGSEEVTSVAVTFQVEQAIRGTRVDGDCSQTTADLPELKYRLVRVLVRVFGLGWAQMNLNVITGSPRATSDDKLGFPLMHGQDAISCVPISVCLLNADQPKMDDRASLARLYPVTSQNLAQFPGKQIFSASTARIHSSVWFTDGSGNRAQPMQGVNVVARWIDPATRKPSAQYAVASVSGFLFCGNAGNVVTGYTAPLGEPYNRFGSNDATLEGFFDLAGLEIPVGTSAQVQLAVEPVDSSWSMLVGPYAPNQVLPSGSASPLLLESRRAATCSRTS